jgi:hypothetical protein
LALAGALGCEPRAHRPTPDAAPTRLATPSAAPTSSLADGGDRSEVQVQAPPSEPKKFELVQGKRVDVGGGVSVELKSVLYAHLSDSRNNSLLIMDVARGDKREQVTLDRLDPVGKEGPKYRPVMGLRMAIDYVDAYHQPSTGAILVLPE